MAKSLTVKSIEAIKPLDKRQEVADSGASGVPGLYFVVQPSGARSWSFRYRSPVDGRPKKYTIGSYPTFSLAEARSQAEELRRAVKRDVDPGEEKRAARARAADRSRDVGRLLDNFIEEHADKKRATTAKLIKQQIEADIRPYWEKRRIETITRADVKAVLKRITDRGSMVHANRVFSLVRKFLNWCVVDAEVIDLSPAQGLKPPAMEMARDRVLTERELRWLWGATAEAGNFGACVRLLLLTGQRRMEVGGMARSELELKTDPPTWTVPAQRTKNGRANIVPLTVTARKAIEAVPAIVDSDLVFTTDGKVPSSGWSKSKVRLDGLMLAKANEEAEKEGREPIIALQPWSLHDLRRTCATGLASLRQPPHVIEAILNHRTGIIGGVAAIYNQFEYLDEKADALSAWESYVLSITGENGHNILAFSRELLPRQA